MKKILSIILSLSLGVSISQAQVVSDPAAHGHLLTSIGIMEKAANHAVDMNRRMTQLNDGIGIALGPLKTVQQLTQFGLMIAGGCFDPLDQLKSLFLGLGNFKGNFDFCSLVQSQAFYQGLLFITGGQEHSPALIEQIRHRREQMIQESISGTLGVGTMQKQQVMRSNSTVKEIRNDFMQNSSNLRDDMRYNNLLLSVIVEHLNDIRLLLIQQNEVLATTASKQISLPY